MMTTVRLGAGSLQSPEVYDRGTFCPSSVCQPYP